MRKLFILFFIMLLVPVNVGFNQSILVEAAKSSNEYGESRVFSTLQSYFDLQNEILISQDLKLLDGLSEMFDDRQGQKAEKYEINKLLFLIKNHQLDNTNVNFVKDDFYIDKIDYLNDKIEVSLRRLVEVDYSYDDEPFLNQVSHKVILKESNGALLIIEDFYETEFTMVYNRDTDFSKEIISLEKNYNQYLNSINEIEDEEYIFDSLGSNTTWDSYSSTDRSDAISYALQYTDNAGTCSTTNYNNSQFKSYGCNDCQNFVSQSIWYGLGGRNSSNKSYPMNSNWWANTSGETTTWNWTSTTHFYNWITDNRINNTFGIHGASLAASNMLIGDYVFVTSPSNHVMLITNISGSPTWGTIYVSAHTNNRKNYNLKSMYGGIASPPSYMKFMRVYGNLAFTPPIN